MGVWSAAAVKSFFKRCNFGKREWFSCIEPNSLQLSVIKIYFGPLWLAYYTLNKKWPKIMPLENGLIKVGQFLSLGSPSIQSFSPISNLCLAIYTQSFCLKTCKSLSFRELHFQYFWLIVHAFTFNTSFAKFNGVIRNDFLIR